MKFFKPKVSFGEDGVKVTKILTREAKWVLSIVWMFLLIVFFIAGIGLVTVRSTVENLYEPIEDNWFQSEDYERTKRLHKFHGIGMSVHVDKGVYGSWIDEYGLEWFKNKEGVICRLWDNKRRTK